MSCLTSILLLCSSAVFLHPSITSMIIILIYSFITVQYSDLHKNIAQRDLIIFDLSICPINMRSIVEICVASY
jgi:hypothetical protein